MSIPVDTYFIVTPGSEFVSKAFSNLNGTDLFFYITETGSLRVVNMVSTGGTATPGTVSFALAQNTKWVGVVQQTGVTHVYFADRTSGNVFYIPYTTFGGSHPAPFALSITGTVTFSVMHTSTSTPPVYIMMADDGIRHNMFVATDPKFQVQVTSQPTVTYNNSLNTAIYLFHPTVTMHPADTNRVTVTFQQTTVLTSAQGVGFYEVRVPGVL
jgi:hypothetical protein